NRGSSGIPPSLTTAGTPAPWPRTALSSRGPETTLNCWWWTWTTSCWSVRAGAAHTWPTGARTCTGTRSEHPDGPRTRPPAVDDRAGLPFPLRRLPRAPRRHRRGAPIGARHRGGGDRRRAVRCGHRVRAAEDGAAPGGLRGRADRRAHAVGGVRRVSGHRRRDGGDAVPAVVDHSVRLPRRGGSAHRAVPQPALAGGARDRHRP